LSAGELFSGNADCSRKTTPPRFLSHGRGREIILLFSLKKEERDAKREERGKRGKLIRNILPLMSFLSSLSAFPFS